MAKAINPQDQTAYLTFLPPLNDGFHTGYHSRQGLVCDHNQHPGEWLENLARYMKTSGQDVGFSIPDVLAAEQQLRRLSRLSPQEAASHQQMTDYRALLCLLLLWDLWPDKDRPLLELRCLSDPDTAFCQAVTDALSPRRAPEGLWVFTLRMPQATESDAQPIALLSHEMILVPAVDPGPLIRLLPPQARWYDRSACRWLDPCAYLNRRDALCLTHRLEVLKQMNEQAALGSPLYDPDAGLCALLDRLIGDIQAARRPWLQALDSGSARQELRTLLLAVYTTEGRLDVQAQTLDPARLSMDGNPLLHSLMGSQPPEPGAAACQVYSFHGQPFAVQSPVCLLEPDISDPAVLPALQRELDLLEKHDPEWRKAASRKLILLSRQLADAAGAWPQGADCLAEWARQLDRLPTPAAVQTLLRYPMEDCPSTLVSLFTDALGLTDAEAVAAPFSDCMTLTHALCLDGGNIPVAGMGEPCYALPPLSPRLCASLAACAEADDLYAPVLQGLDYVYDAGQNAVTARFTLTRRTPGQGAALSSAITFERAYRLSSQFQSGNAVVIDDLPQVTVWPNVRLTAGLWKSYYVFTAHSSQLDAWALDEQGWVQGRLYARDGLSWQTACVSRFPAYVALRRGALSMGALVNDIPRQVLKREEPCAIAIDFGSISTTVMLRQGERVQPALLPAGLHRQLLASPHPMPLEEAFLPAWALQDHPTYYSVMDMFTDQPDHWTGVLRDGHIYYPQSTGEMMDKQADSLYYDLKWGQEEYARKCLRLFLKQVMLQALLSTRLAGSYSASYRVSMPNAMPLPKREAYLDMVRGLSRELAEETGLPLTTGIPPVLYATENQADGRYFRSRSEVNAQAGYLNLDIGGGTADLSLWLNNASHASMECSLLLGCRQMLFDSLMDRHPREMEQDFDLDGLRDSVLQLTQLYKREGATQRGRHKCMLLLDDLFAVHAPDIRRCMAQARADGRITYVESLLLFELGFLLTLAGEMLQRAHRDKALSPLLPRRMELCIAGNGGQLFKIFSDEQLSRLCDLAMLRLDTSHPLRLLYPIQSRHPKQEVAMGLLEQDGGLQSAIQAADRWNGTFEGTDAPDVLADYLSAFYRLFPQAAHRLMPGAFQEDALTAASLSELTAIRSNLQSRYPRDDFSFYVACFVALKRLWLL